MLEVYQFPCLNDNYGFLIEDKETGKVACIDTPDGDEIIKMAKHFGLRIDEVWNTHGHNDHAGGNAKIKSEFGAIIRGPIEVKTRGHAIDEVIEAGGFLELGASKARIINLAGHTLSQIGFVFEEENAAFVGDAIFVLGCGRLFEGTAEMAWAGISNFMQYSDEMHIYCAHEYSAANAKFCESLGLSNPELKARIEEIYSLSDEGIPTVPTQLGIERKTSPFLLADKEKLKNEIGLEKSSDLEAFAFIRKAKDVFKG